MGKGNNMAYLIDRNKLWNYIKAQINPYGKPFKGSAYDFGTKLMDHILDMETIEAKSVVHGEWIAQDATYTRFMCSACNSKNYSGHHNFCPNCGARMDGE